MRAEGHSSRSSPGRGWLGWLAKAFGWISAKNFGWISAGFWLDFGFWLSFARILRGFGFDLDFDLILIWIRFDFGWILI